MKIIEKPEFGEYPFYASMYIELLPNDGLLLKHLKDNLDLVKALISALPEEKWSYRYAPDKWTIKEVLVHIIDDERIYAYRALCFARNEKTALLRQGVANKNKATVRAMGYHIAGHELHHINIIKEKYL